MRLINRKERKMKSSSNSCVIIVLFVVFIIFLLNFIDFQNKETYTSNEKNKQIYASDFIHIAKRNESALTNEEISLKPKVMIKGKGSYKLEHPTGVRKNVISWSQYGQDQFLDKLFDQKQNGFFLEIGGYDGESFSNTLFFEKIRNWNGLLVEANPYTYDIMFKKDRKCYMVNACVSKSLPSMSFVLAGGITSAKETLTERHRKRIVRDKITYGKHKNWAHASETVKVDCLTFRQLMRTVGRNSIDYFSLDVEGAEMHILNSIEWEEINIDVFTIETDQHREEILSFMKQKGYKWIQKLQGDDIFRKIK
ncbi:uncharacterized protein LOC143053412 [Mytilus galloprovincialis]|uniref:uncharacterized protein LOC143053412 n=1 Tax=Mytilus galloprovincialis TaxID=29158 RepID=UPI003F7B9987